MPITNEQIRQAYAHATGLRIVASQADLGPRVQLLRDMLDWCRRHEYIVVLNNGDILAANPTSRQIQNCKALMQQKGVRPGQVLPADENVIRTLLINVADETQEILSPEKVSEQQHRLRHLVKDALNLEASDIHIEVREDATRIRFRRHGELYLHAEWLPKLGREIAAVAFNKETEHAVTHFNPLIPQNASMVLDIDGVDVRLRISSMPAHSGFDVVFRLLSGNHQATHTLEDLGYTPQQIQLLKRAVNMPHGAVIISGPTGSGKTTTLASCMQLVDKHRKVYTIEDPVEQVIELATQIPIHHEHEDRNFASMGRAALRMDPDVMVLGEMRDEATARVMIRAAITGHLVFSTLHTNTAPAIISRLIDLGVSPRLLSDPNVLVALICQRLIPKLCGHCKQPIFESRIHNLHLESWRSVFGEALSHLYTRGPGCSECKNTGISGRTVVAEMIWLDEQSRQFIRDCDLLSWERYLRSHGWQTYVEQALMLVRLGVCDPLDAEKVVGPINDNGGREIDYKKFQMISEGAKVVYGIPGRNDTVMSSAA